MRYYELLKPFSIQKPQDITVDNATRLYFNNLNLEYELMGLLPGSSIYDVGCGYGAGTEGLQRIFPHYRFVGIDLFSQPVLHGETVTVPVMEGSISELPEEVKSKIDSSLYPPHVILLNNILQLIVHAEINKQMPGLVEDALLGIHGALPTGGKALIYDGNRGNFTYSEYLRRIKKMGLEFTSDIGILKIPPLRSDLCPQYLRLQKVK